jgi:uncharacterized membrane protein YcjF (UPF0283 family)
MNDDELYAGVPQQSFRPNTVSELPHQRLRVATDLTERQRLDTAERHAGVPSQAPSAVLEVRGAPVDWLPTEVKLIDDDAIAPTYWSSGLRSPLLSALLLLAVSALLLVVLSEVFQFVQVIQSASLPLQVVAYLCGGVLIICFGWSALRLANTYRKLSTSPQVAVTSIDNAHGRAFTRRQIEEERDAGVLALRSIVESYPIDEKEHLAFLRKMGCNDEDINTLRGNIRFLLESEGAGRAKWLEDCEQKFIRLVDDIAKRRVADYAKRVAVKTAVMPTGFFDSLIVASNAVFLVEELCKCYYVRTSLGNSLLIVIRLVFSTFVSARLEDRIDAATDSLFDGALSSIHEMAKEAFAKVTLNILKRTAEGTINYALFYRLGGAAILYLRPIRLK